MFDWLKSKSHRETGRLNALLAEVFTQLETFAKFPKIP